MSKDFMMINCWILHTVLLAMNAFHACDCEAFNDRKKVYRTQWNNIIINDVEPEPAETRPTKLNMIIETPTTQDLYLGYLKKYDKIRRNSVTKNNSKTKSEDEFQGSVKKSKGKRRNEISGVNEMKNGLLRAEVADKQEDQRPVKRQHFEEGYDFHHHHHLEERPILGRCDINEKCKAEQYCEGTYCFKCRKEDEHCYANGQCCQGMECQYGYCAKGISAGMPGTYCDKAKDCKGSDSCCILEMSVDHHNPICKPTLEEHETCGPINLFHQVTEYRAHNEPFCGPCKQGLACKSIGIHGHHSVCLPEGGD